MHSSGELLVHSRECINNSSRQYIHCSISYIMDLYMMITRLHTSTTCLVISAGVLLVTLQSIDDDVTMQSCSLIIVTLAHKKWNLLRLISI